MEFFLGVVSIAILVSLTRELFAAFPGADHAEVAMRRGKPKGILALTSPLLAGVGVGVCLFAGAKSMLWWLDWQLSDGVQLRSAVAAVFAFYGTWIVGDRWRSLRQAGFSSREA